MRVIVQTDSSRVHQKMRAMRRERPAASRAAIATTGGLVARFVYENTPQATRRMQNAAHGQVMACVAMGGDVTPTAKPVLRAAPDRERQIEVMRRSVERAQERESRWLKRVRNLEVRPGGPVYKRGPKKGRPWKSYTDALKALDRAGKVTDEAIVRLEEFLASDGSAPTLVVRGRRNRRGRFGVSQLSSTRTRVYGGTAEYQPGIGGSHLLTLRNREPHARFVNRRHGLYSNAQRYASFTGARRASRVYFEAMRRAA